MERTHAGEGKCLVVHQLFEAQWYWPVSVFSLVLILEDLVIVVA